MVGPFLGLFWVLLLGSVLFLALVLFLVLGVATASLPGIGAGKVMLNCPHCGAETPAQDPECRHCRKSFRDESINHPPVIDAPRLRSPK